MLYPVQWLRRLLGTAGIRDLLLQVQQQTAPQAHCTPAAPPPPTPATLTGTRDAVRQLIARTYLRGEGIEVGAFASPLPLPEGARARYVDKYGTGDINALHTICGLTLADFGINSADIVVPDIVDDGETLAKVGDYSQDFVVANHVLEHFEDPLKGFKNLLRVLRHGGILYLSLPEMRHSFDHVRAPTPFAHLERDYDEGPAWSRHQAYREFAEIFAGQGMDKGLFPRATGGALEAMVQRQAVELEQVGFSIHFHAWTMDGMQELFLRAKQRFALAFETRLMLQNEDEVVFVFQKTVPAVG